MKLKVGQSTLLYACDARTRGMLKGENGLNERAPRESMAMWTTGEEAEREKRRILVFMIGFVVLMLVFVQMVGAGPPAPLAPPLLPMICARPDADAGLDCG